jgi:cell division protein FtsX
MNVQETLNNGCRYITATLADAGNWLGYAVTVMGNTVALYAQKTADLARSYYPHVKDFLTQNKAYVFVAGAATALGVVIAMLLGGRKKTEAPASA